MLIEQGKTAEISHWLGELAHELRTPLAGARVLAEYLLCEDVPADDKDPVFLHSLHEQLIRMSDLLEDLLELARLDSEAAEWAWSSFRVRNVLEAAADAVRPLINHQRVTFHCQVAPDDLQMEGDSVALGRLVTNLLRNAQKFTADGSIELSAGHRVDENGLWVVIRVRDTGAGIPRDLLPKLGTPFVRGAPSAAETTAPAKGAGLGLAICRGIAQAHGGAVSIRSMPGQGTQVQVELRADLPGPR